MYNKAQIWLVKAPIQSACDVEGLDLQLVAFEELMEAARTPTRAAVATWSRINANSGEIVIASPMLPFPAPFPTPGRGATGRR